MSEQTVFAHGDFKAPCLVWRSGDDVEVTLTAVRPDDIAALMHAMKTVCGATCALIAGGVMTLVQCLRVEGRECRGFRAGSVEFALSLRALPESKPAAPPEWNTLKIGGVPAPAHCGDKLGPLTCMCAKGHDGAHRDGLNVWYARDGYDFTATRPLPHPGTAVEALTRFVIGVDRGAHACAGCGDKATAMLAGKPACEACRGAMRGPPDCACGRYIGEAHAPGCLVRAAEERRQPCDGCAAPPEGKGFTEWRHADNCPHVLAAARDAEIDAATEREMAAAYRREQEAPLVALVAAVPEGLDPIGWRAAAITTDEAFVRMPADERPDPGGWGWRLERTIRGDRVLASEGTWMHAALSNGRDAYRRALTRQPPPMRPGRVLACNAYDVPGQP